MVACLTTIVFTTATLIPSPFMIAGVNLDLQSINFGIRIERLYEKLKRAIEKGETNKIVHCMFDIKDEVEQYTGKKIDIGRQIDQAQREAEARGQRVDDRYIKQIKRDFDREDKRRQH